MVVLGSHLVSLWNTLYCICNGLLCRHCCVQSVTKHSTEKFILSSETAETKWALTIACSAVGDYLGYITKCLFPEWSSLDLYFIPQSVLYYNQIMRGCKLHTEHLSLRSFPNFDQISNCILEWILGSRFLWLDGDFKFVTLTWIFLTE